MGRAWCSQFPWGSFHQEMSAWLCCDKESERERQKDVRLPEWGRSWSTIAPRLSKASKAMSWICYFCLSEKDFTKTVHAQSTHTHTHIYTHTYSLFPCLKGECNSPEWCIFFQELFLSNKGEELLLHDKEVSEWYFKDNLLRFGATSLYTLLSDLDTSFNYSYLYLAVFLRSL